MRGWAYINGKEKIFGGSCKIKEMPNNVEKILSAIKEAEEEEKK